MLQADAVPAGLRCPCGGAYAAGAVAAEPKYRVVRCVSCGLVSMDPRTSTDVDYDFGYFKKNYLDRLSPWRRSHAHWFEHMVAPLAATRQRPRILDVGCGIGIFLSVVPPSWERVGIEPSTEACAIGRREFGLDLRPLRLEDVPPGEGFDFVTFWDVVEHLPDPVATLAAARRHLRPDGLLIVKVPDIAPRALAAGRLLARAGKGSIIFHVGAHLYQFDERSLRATLERAGYSPRELASYRAPHGVLNFFTKGRLTGRIARLGLHAAGLDRTLIAVSSAVACRNP